MAEEHITEMQNLDKKDKQELQRLRNTLERLQLEFETFLNEDTYSYVLLSVLFSVFIFMQCRRLTQGIYVKVK